MEYICLISQQVRDFRMYKDVPPMGWKMPFVAKTEVCNMLDLLLYIEIVCKTFQFKTHLQRFNLIEASSRAKLNSLKALYRFHKQQGNLAFLFQPLITNFWTSGCLERRCKSWVDLKL